MNNTTSPWFTHYNQPMKNQARLFAFPYSCAGISAYHQWSEGFSQQGIDFIGVQLPGRENRLSDNPISQLPLLIDNLLSAMTPLTDKPFVFFGHSLGALVAFELCRALRKKGLNLPLHLFVSAFRPPSRPNPNKVLHQLTRNDFIDGIRAYGNTLKKCFQIRC
jgi:medium-chain acyl-[acyl-carrier-protein] hydrolase